MCIIVTFLSIEYTIEQRYLSTYKGTYLQPVLCRVAQLFVDARVEYERAFYLSNTSSIVAVSVALVLGVCYARIDQSYVSQEICAKWKAHMCV